MYTRLVTFLLFVTTIAYSQSGVLLNDFETDLDVDAVQWKSHPSDGSLARSSEFATSGSSSLHFHCPAWVKGQPEWPSFEFVPKTADWTPFDRLLIDITNPGDASPEFHLYAVDSKIRLQSGLGYSFRIQGRHFERFVISLSDFPKEVDRAHITRFHLFTSHPVQDFDLYIDQIRLLRPGEALPAEPSGNFVKQLAALQAAPMAEAIAQLTKQGDGIQDKSISAQFHSILSRANEFSNQFANDPPSTLSKFDALTLESRELARQAERLLSMDHFVTQSRKAGLPVDHLLVGRASSMEKIPPRDQPFTVDAANEIRLNAARRGHDSQQLLILPIHETAHKVHLTVSALKNDTGDSLPSASIRCRVTGYVKTETHPPYHPSYTGWWPDPILDFLGPIDIPAGDLQSFWVSVSVPENQTAGLYRGEITLHPEGLPDRAIPLYVKVRRYAVPKVSPLPVAITFSPSDHPQPDTKSLQAQWRKHPDYPVNLWKKQKNLWIDFLADYYINYDNLYRSGSPDWDVLTRLRDQGRLRAFNLRLFGGALTHSPESRERALAATRVDYEKAKELGILDKAYIYGFDEVPADQFPTLESAAAELKRVFPDLPIMTTALDASYGLESQVKSIDAWCPLTPYYDLSKAQAARKGGKKVWWYICCCPATSPHANMFVENHGIEGRLLMGAMSAKYQVDGFLYYQISIWNSEKPITSGPYTDWNPRSWRSWNGDGSWTCVGPDGVPVPTIRLENFRDGLQDYAAHRLLAATVAAEKRDPKLSSDSSAKWIAAATDALVIPDSLVTDMLQYSRDAEVLLNWRKRIDDLLDANFRPEIDLWESSGFSVR